MTFVLICALAHSFAQNKKSNTYGTLQVFGYSHDKGLAAGPHFSFGYYNSNFGIGPGIGIVVTGGDEPYIPVYANITYAGGKSKLSPMGQFQFGKAIKGGGDFVDEDIYQTMKPGFYGTAKAGAALRFKRNRLHALAGVTLMSFEIGTGSGARTINNSVFTFGLGLFTTN